MLLSQALDAAKNKKNKDHDIKNIPQLPYFFNLLAGEFISQDISSLRLGLENK